ncbi:hypothetical protein CLF_105310, partial [Clonorchis sinensis]
LCTQVSINLLRPCLIEKTTPTNKGGFERQGDTWCVLRHSSEERYFVQMNAPGMNILCQFSVIHLQLLLADRLKMLASEGYRAHALVDSVPKVANGHLVSGDPQPAVGNEGKQEEVSHPTVQHTRWTSLRSAVRTHHTISPPQFQALPILYGNSSFFSVVHVEVPEPNKTAEKFKPKRLCRLGGVATRQLCRTVKFVTAGDLYGIRVSFPGLHVITIIISCKEPCTCRTVVVAATVSSADDLGSCLDTSQTRDSAGFQVSLKKLKKRESVGVKENVFGLLMGINLLDPVAVLTKFDVHPCIGNSCEPATTPLCRSSTIVSGNETTASRKETSRPKRKVSNGGGNRGRIVRVDKHTYCDCTVQSSGP